MIVSHSYGKALSHIGAAFIMTLFMVPGRNMTQDVVMLKPENRPDGPGFEDSKSQID